MATDKQPVLKLLCDLRHKQRISLGQISATDITLAIYGLNRININIQYDWQGMLLNSIQDNFIAE